MEIVHCALADSAPNLPQLRVSVDRQTLAKRRWRGVAEDGREFGFDLELPLADGATVFASESARYVIAQQYESVLEVRSADFAAGNAAAAARLGWIIGNLHFQIEVAGDLVRVVDDPAVRQLFAREGVPFVACKRVFHPLSGGHRH